MLYHGRMIANHVALRGKLFLHQTVINEANNDAYSMFHLL